MQALNVLNRWVRRPLWVHAALLLLTFFYWRSGIEKLLDFSAAQAEMAHFGLQPTALFAALTIALQLIAPALIALATRWATLAAGALAGFTLITIPLAHRFWESTGVQAALERALVFEHLSMVGALMCAAALVSLWRAKGEGSVPIARG